jgi:hypothetical protein
MKERSGKNTNKSGAGYAFYVWASAAFRQVNGWIDNDWNVAMQDLTQYCSFSTVRLVLFV